MGRAWPAPERPAVGSPSDDRARGEAVAIADALGSDLKNLESLRPMIAVLAPGADTQGGMSELVEHLAAELDYVAEGENQMAFRALVAGRSGVSVPEVHRSHGAHNVLVSDWVQGRTLRDIAAEGSQALRDAVGVTIFRTALGLAFNHGVFNTDPHPGNYLVDDEGVVHLLDFGSVKRLPDEIRVRWRHLATLLVRGDRVEIQESADKFRTAVAFGSAQRPAFFKQKRDGSEETVEGTAERIDFDEKNDTLRLSGNPVVRRMLDAKMLDEVTGTLITWDNRTEFFTVDGGAPTTASPAGRVRMLLSPRQAASGPAATASSPAKAANPASPPKTPRPAGTASK